MTSDGATRPLSGRFPFAVVDAMTAAYIRGEVDAVPPPSLLTPAEKAARQAAIDADIEREAEQARAARDAEVRAAILADPELMRQRLELLTAEVSAEPQNATGGNLRLRFRTARAIAQEAPVVIPWRIYGYLADGAIAELSGPVKRAGKTTFSLGATRAVLDGGEFIGRPCHRSPVVYLTEQPDTSLRPALERAGLLEREDLVLLSLADARGNPWRAIVAAAVEQCEEVGARVLIIDTLPQFAGIHGDAENDAGSALAAMEPLQDAAAKGLAILVIRHDRKTGGDVGESARGSSAFTGAVDVVMRLARQVNPVRPTVRTLSAVSRFAETPEELVVELVDGRYISLGDASAVAHREAEAAVLDRLAAGDATMDELVEAIGLKRTTVQDAVGGLVAGGRVVRTGAGKRGNPYRFRVPAGVSAGVSADGSPDSLFHSAALTGGWAAESFSDDDAVEIDGRLLEVPTGA